MAGEGRPHPGCPVVCQGSWVLWGRGRHGSSTEQSGRGTVGGGPSLCKGAGRGQSAGWVFKSSAGSSGCELTLNGWLMELRQVDYRLGLVSARRVAAGSPGLESVWVDKTVTSWDCLRNTQSCPMGNPFVRMSAEGPPPLVAGMLQSHQAAISALSPSPTASRTVQLCIFLPRPLGLFLGARQGALFPCPLWSPSRHFWGSALIGQGDRAWSAWTTSPVTWR